uniref:Uncharacterized protein n=1 Tax=Tanacetum cinerariifolium TaxID=118510 RepID=A0A699HFD6_TANCI|nr:hypothetical protein [Tanacetum cinerariifolium]
MRSIIFMVSISLEGFLPSILLLVVIIVAVVIVAVILVVVVINAIVGVVIVVASIGVVVVVMTIGIVMVDGVFLLGLSAFAMAAACASRAAATPSVISCQMVASVIVGVADVDVLLGGIYQHIHANTEYRLREIVQNVRGGKSIFNIGIGWDDSRLRGRRHDYNNPVVKERHKKDNIGSKPDKKGEA